MENVFIAYDADDEFIHDIIGVFETETKAKERCEELFEEYGFDLEEDDVLFNNRFFVESFNVR